MVIAAGALAALSTAASHAQAVPLPEARPATAPDAVGQADQPAKTGNAEPDKSAPGPDTKPDAAEAAVPPPPTPCRLALTDAIAVAPSATPISGPGACGGDDLVRLEAVVLPDKQRVAVKPAATMRCTMATAIADWVRTDMTTLAQGLSTRVTELDNLDSFDCRGRNGVAGAKLSEHGRANALDVRALRFANGQTLTLTDRNASHELRDKVLASACNRFTTVLGPGSDGYHEEHIHLDLAERHNGYRICHWEVYDPKPLLPEPRPDGAPSREVVASAPDAGAPAESAKSPSDPTRRDDADKIKQEAAVAVPPTVSPAAKVPAEPAAPSPAPSATVPLPAPREIVPSDAGKAVAEGPAAVPLPVPKPRELALSGADTPPVQSETVPSVPEQSPPVPMPSPDPRVPPPEAARAIAATPTAVPLPVPKPSELASAATAGGAAKTTERRVKSRRIRHTRWRNRPPDFPLLIKKLFE